jgi:beta-xylosidase
LKLTGDFRPGHHDVANFYYSIDGKEWKQIGTKNYQMRFDYRRFFMGTKFAIFCYATKKKGGYVDVDAFDYQRE